MFWSNTKKAKLCANIHKMYNIYGICYKLNVVLKYAKQVWSNTTKAKQCAQYVLLYKKTIGQCVLQKCKYHWNISIYGLGLFYFVNFKQLTLNFVSFS